MAKNDRRVRYTKQVIKQSLIELLQTTPMEQITVKALCEKAEINRATFYNHYETFSLLLEEIEYETYKIILSKLNNVPFDENHPTLLLKTILHHLQEYPTTRDVFLSKVTAGSGLLRLLQELQKDNRLSPSLHSSISPQQSQWILTYMSSGIREVLRQWFASGMENEDLLIETLSLFINSGIKAFIKQ